MERWRTPTAASASRTFAPFRAYDVMSARPCIRASTPSLRDGTGTTRTSLHVRPALASSPKVLYQMARLAGYSPVTRLPLTSYMDLIGESRRTIGEISSGEIGRASCRERG